MGFLFILRHIHCLFVERRLTIRSFCSIKKYAQQFTVYIFNLPFYLLNNLDCSIKNP